MSYPVNTRADSFPYGLSKRAPKPVISNRAPTSSDVGYEAGTPWVDSSANLSYINSGTSGGISHWSGTGYPISFFVVGQQGRAPYQTIQSAINAAAAIGGGTVYVQPGIYTENLILYNGVDLWGAVGVADTATCKIIGIMTPPLSGAVTIRNIFLQSLTNIFQSSAAGTANIILIDVAVAVTNGFTFNLPNWAGGFVGFDIGEIGSTNDGWINNTGGAVVFMTNITMGSGSSNTMVTSGSVELYDCVINCPVNFQTGSSVLIDGGTLFNNSVIFSNNSTGVMNNSSISSGSSAAITMDSSGSWIVSNCTITSSNNPAIAGSGAGTLNIAGATFISNSNVANTLTLGTTSVTISPTIRVNGDAGGSTGFTSLSAINSTTISTGVGSVKMSNGNAGTNAAWIKIYIGTTPYWIPAWATNEP